LKRWQAERAHLRERNAAVGVVLKSSDAPAALAPDLDHLAVIAIEFPVFRDGRGFSYAHRLRTQMGYSGELRAFGHILPDQVLFLCPLWVRPLRRKGSPQALQLAARSLQNHGLVSARRRYAHTRAGAPTSQAGRRIVDTDALSLRHDVDRLRRQF